MPLAKKSVHSSKLLSHYSSMALLGNILKSSMMCFKNSYRVHLAYGQNLRLPTSGSRMLACVSKTESPRRPLNIGSLSLKKNFILSKSIFIGHSLGFSFSRHPLVIPRYTSSTLLSRRAFSTAGSQHSLQMGFPEKFAVALVSLATTLFILYYYETVFFTALLLHASDILSLRPALLSTIESYLTQGTDFSLKLNGPITFNLKSGNLELENVMIGRTAGDDVSTPFDIQVHSLLVDLSAEHFHYGKGFLKSVKASNISGDLYRVLFDDRPLFKLTPAWGDFQLSLSLENVNLTFHYPNRTAHLTLNSADVPLLRKHWLIRDILRGNIFGIYDGALFSLGPPFTGDYFLDKKLSAVNILKVESLDLWHFTQIDSLEKGTVDLQVLFTGNKDDVETQPSIEDISRVWNLSREAKKSIFLDPTETSLDIHLRVTHIQPKKSATSITSSLLYLTPLLTYMNHGAAPLPLSCYLTFPDTHFQGSVTLYDTEIIQMAAKELICDLNRWLREERNTWTFTKNAALWHLGIPRRFSLTAS